MEWYTSIQLDGNTLTTTAHPQRGLWKLGMMLDFLWRSIPGQACLRTELRIFGEQITSFLIQDRIDAREPTFDARRTPPKDVCNLSDLVTQVVTPDKNVPICFGQLCKCLQNRIRYPLSKFDMPELSN